ncbi:hypothetical protein [Parasediminibacterium sp. JCM 36343]|uniref:hypothetical protein n=1 Tax=Parasediminibacterium sp. JCM 36343 TaxID=3374279 RepID=UPI00397E72E9
MLNEELEKLIGYALADGVLTEKEKSVLMKKAGEYGVDKEELEMILDGRLFEMNKNNKATTTTKSNKFGDLDKCPSCGAAVASFSAKCNDCGYEFKNLGANKSVEALSAKLQAIVDACEGKSYKHMVGRLHDNEESARRDDVLTKQRDVIKNFPIPNTVDDILELLHFMSPKTRISITSDKNVAAWRNKFQEILSRAKVVFANDSKMLAELEKYGSIQETSKLDKATLLYISLNSIAKKILLFIVALIVMCIVFGCLQLFGNSEISKEEKRLNGIEKAVIEDIKEKNLDDATVLLNQLEWSVTDDTQKTFMDNYLKVEDKYQAKRDYWENKKTELEKLINETKTKN